MSKIKIHAGDFLVHDYDHGQLLGKKLKLPVSQTKLWIIPLWTNWGKIKLTEVAEIEKADEENVKRVGGAAGWGAAGAVILGPVGLLAGLLLGGKGKDVTFVAKFKDGRKLLATISSKDYIKLQSAVFK